MNPFEFKDHTADVLFIARGKDLSELFKNSGLATMDTMVDLKSVGKAITKKISLKEKDAEALLFSFLEEIVFLKDAESMLFSDFKIKIDNNKLQAELIGEKIDINKHKLRVDVKAITLHEFYLKKTDKGYKAQVILDI